MVSAARQTEDMPKPVRSPEVASIVARWMRARQLKDGRTLTALISTSFAVKYVGSDIDEVWSGPVVRDGYARHVEEVPDYTADCIETEAFESGCAGWATWIGDLCFKGRPGVFRFRFSFVLVLEESGWRIVQVHVSTPRSNMEIIGVEHAAYRALIEAAESGGSARESNRRQNAVMFSDIADSTRLAARVGDRAWSARVGAHLDLIARETRRAGGILVKSLGDGAMVTFESPRQALSAARAIQAAVSDGRDEPPLRVRIGVHVGELVEDAGDVFGTAVHKAARIAAEARPGEVLVSRAVFAHLDCDPDFAFEAPFWVTLSGFEGEHELAAFRWAQ